MISCKIMFQVGFFPAEHVEMIGERVPQTVTTKIPVTPKPGMVITNVTE